MNAPWSPRWWKKTENTTLVGFIKTFSLSFSKMPHESSDQTSIGQLRVQLSVATLTRSHGTAIWHTEHTWNHVQPFSQRTPQPGESQSMENAWMRRRRDICKNHKDRHLSTHGRVIQLRHPTAEPSSPWTSFPCNLDCNIFSLSNNFVPKLRFSPWMMRPPKVE